MYGEEAGGSIPRYEFTLGGEEENKIDIPLTVFRILVCSVGIIGNLLVIFVILILAEYKKAVTHWYVLQLAVADTVFLLTIPFRIVEDFNGAWIFPEWMCKAKETILFLNYYSSIGFLMIMSIDRYIAVCHGFSSFLQKFRTPFAALVITAAVWIISLLICIPIMMYSTPRGVEPKCKCEYEFPNPPDYRRDCIENEGHEEGTDDFEECLRNMENGTIFAGTSDGACVKQDEFDFESFWQNYYGEETSSGASSGAGKPVYGGAAYGGAYGGMAYGGAGASTNESDYAPEATTASVNQADLLYPGCHYHKYAPGFKAFLFFNFIVMFLVPCIVMTVCYTLIVLRLKRTRLRSDSEGGIPSSNSVSGPSTSVSGKRKRSKSAASMKDKRNRNRVTLMCACLVVLFVVCWLPFHSVHLAKMTGIRGKTDFCIRLFHFASLLAFVNSALNPYLYNFIGTRFGKRLRSAASTVQRSVKRSTSSISGSVRYHYKKRSSQQDGGSSSQTATVMTKIYKGKSEAIATSDPSSNVFTEDTKHFEERQRLTDNNATQPADIEITDLPADEQPPNYHDL